MSDWTLWALQISGLVIVALLCLASIAATVWQLPGTWITLLLVAALAWWQPDRISLITVLVMLGGCIVGEILESLTAAVGARHVGGSKRGMVLAVAGAILGAIVGTIFIPVPVVGAIIGACLGAAGLTLLGDRWAGRTWKQSWASARGAAIGKFTGTIAKIVVHVLMCLWLIVAMCVAGI